MNKGDEGEVFTVPDSPEKASENSQLTLAGSDDELQSNTDRCIFAFKRLNDVLECINSVVGALIKLLSPRAAKLGDFERFSGQNSFLSVVDALH